MTAPRTLFVAVATAAGLLGGWMLAQKYLGAHKAPLFSPVLRRRGLRVVRELELALG